ncbi:hypothetical protein BK655_12205 [Pseudomonas brassicacearum]|nr:hypothetical protein BK655_12205 [Pseudomonas brassicacearum]
MAQFFCDHRTSYFFLRSERPTTSAGKQIYSSGCLTIAANSSEDLMMVEGSTLEGCLDLTKRGHLLRSTQQF